MKRLTLTVFLISHFSFLICAVAQQHRLWYNQPAQTWTQALPIGNGVMGGMVFGTPAVEHIQMNEETIWAGQPNNVRRRCQRFANSSSKGNTRRHKTWLTHR